ncbi:glycoside hydrolase domain-containing protein [Puia sp. P3]|uniref:glycoside hydrolase domain-containing protein n=1 Tax=Puia sp. P3 TaxID=3423952 RepID=UPI003D671B67
MPGHRPVCAGNAAVQKATIHLENGKDFVISAPANSATNLYVQGATLQGQPYGRNWISHTDIQQGGEFQLNMGATPNKSKGTGEGDFPYSFSTDKDNPLKKK